MSGKDTSENNNTEQHNKTKNKRVASSPLLDDSQIAWSTDTDTGTAHSLKSVENEQ